MVTNTFECDGKKYRASMYWRIGKGYGDIAVRDEDGREAMVIGRCLKVLHTAIVELTDEARREATES